MLDDAKPLEYLLDRKTDSNDGLEVGERALARAIASTTLRRKGQIDKVLANLMSKPLGKRGGSAMHIMRCAAAQILFMDVADHASVSIAMDMAKADYKARHFAKLINGVLRTLVREKDETLQRLEPLDALPPFLCKSWLETYGKKTTRDIANALMLEPYLDLSIKPGAETSALEGHVVPGSESIRLNMRGSVPKLPGFDAGDWWVQDIAASIAPRLLGDVKGLKIADLCAAPGGKTAYLAARGADVTAVDLSKERLEKTRENLERLKLDAELVTADIMDWKPDTLFDAVLLDAPCSATGTARKHPDIFWLKSEDLVQRMAKIQRALLKRAVEFLRPGGLLVFCTCSLEQAEGEAIVQFVKEQNLPLDIVPVVGDEIFGLTKLLNGDGTLRTRPDHSPFENKIDSVSKAAPFHGLDGFFIARFRKID